MSTHQANGNEPAPWGWGLVVAGIYPVAVATNLLPNPSHSANDAPLWVLFLVGTILSAAGAIVVVGSKSRMSNLFAAILLAAMGGIGLWATCAPAEKMSGGIPFVPRALNVLIGRSLFGSGVLLSCSLCLYALRQFAKPHKS